MYISHKRIIREKYTAKNGFVFRYLLIKAIRRSSSAPYHEYSLFASIKGKEYYDERFVNALTTSRQRAIGIFRLVSAGLVTPVTLLDVLEDLL